MPDQFVKFPRRESIVFFEKAMNNHSRVSRYRCLSDSYYEIYRNELPTIKVFVANYYALSVSDYYDIVSDYEVDCLVTISKWNRVTQDAYELGKSNGIGVFKMDEFLGALNNARPCTYIRPIDRENNDRGCSGFAGRR
ncbi:hypothetical protein [Granulicatella adiacens]|uniref:hypothetical protein n=1 Tax=Granulicatella adiacens TaxID=46124 RepID=UPI00402A19F6